MTRVANGLSALVLGLLPSLSWAQCSRALQVPVSPVGFAVAVADGKVGGIYPDLLREFAAKAGCTVAFEVVPSARQGMMFETGQSDVLLPARRSLNRDQNGEFVPMLKSRPALVSMQAAMPAIHSLTELLQHAELRVVIVRGLDYDIRYQAAIKELETRHRLVTASDPLSAARLLDDGEADVTIMMPSILTGVLREAPQFTAWIKRLTYQHLDDIDWGESGVYISDKSSLNPADRRLLHAILERMAKSGRVWSEFLRYYPDEKLTDTVRPR